MNLLTVALIGLGALLVVGALVWLTRIKARSPRAARQPDWDNAAVQKFFAEVAADEKLFGIVKKDSAQTEARKAEQLQAIEKLLASSEYLSLTEEQQEMRVKLLADESVVHFVEETVAHSQENERLIVELHARREEEARASVNSQAREADLRRLSEMEQRARAGGNKDPVLLNDIQGLRQRLSATKRPAS